MQVSLSCSSVVVDHQELKLSWDRVVKQFENLVKYAARQQIETRPTDQLMSVEDLYQEGMIKLYDCWMKWCVDPCKNKDIDEFKPIFTTSLFRHMRKYCTNKAELIDLDEIEEFIGDTNVEDTVERMYREHGLTHLSEILTCSVAKKLLEELIEPSTRTLYEVLADIKRKQMLKSQGKKVNVPKDTTVRMKHIQRSLGITSKQYDNAIAEIREKARLAMNYN